MKILHIYKDFYPPVIGGIEKHLNILSKKLKTSGVEVEILVSNTSNRVDVAYVDGIKVTKIPQWGRLLSAPLNPTMGYWIRKLGQSCDILHFHLPNPTGVMGYLMSGLRKTVVVTYHSDIVRQRRTSKFFTPFLNYFLKNDVAKIIATSQNIKENSRILKLYSGKTDVIPLGIDVDDFMDRGDSVNSQRLKDQYGEKILLFIGKFRYYKGLNVLIEAMRNIDATLIIVGNGPNAEKIKETVKRYGLHQKIILMNEVSDTVLMDCIHACQMLILPSVQKSEAFGLVLLEAMACGKPVISTDLGTGTSFVNVHNHTGLVVAPNSARELERAVRQLLEKPEEKTIFGKNAQKRAAEFFNADLMAARTMALYSSLTQ